MRTRTAPAHLLVLIALLFGITAATANADESAGSAGVSPMTLTPEEFSSFEDAAGMPESENASVVDDAGSFVSDNAPYFIIGIIVLAAILAGILIMRGRHKAGTGRKESAPTAKAAAGATGAKAAAATGAKASKSPSAPASVPSATELRRRKRAAMQRAREEERLRRRAGKGGARGATGGALAPSPSAAMNPDEAEKQAARDQASAAGAVGRVGTTITPPAAGTTPVPASSGQTVPGAAGAPPAASAGAETPTAVNPAPLTDGEEVIAPGPDAAVGRAAAAFAAGATGGAIAGQVNPNDALEAKVAEIKAAQESATTPVVPDSAPDFETPAEPARIVPDRPDPSQPAPPVASGFTAVERQLSADSAERDRVLKVAEERLLEIERRAEDAERRAAFAESLARLKLEESERERRLEDIMSGINRAEERARGAEERAEAAERAAASALEHGSTSRGRADSGTPVVPPTQTAGSPLQPPPTVSTSPSSTRSLSGGVSLNSATFEELREADLSVTQATRILAYRERFGGYTSIEDLERVPGFPPDTVESLRGRFTV